MAQSDLLFRKFQLIAIHRMGFEVYRTKKHDGQVGSLSMCRELVLRGGRINEYRRVGAGYARGRCNGTW